MAIAGKVVIVSLAGAIIYTVVQAIYDLYFHPLAKVPGRKLWAITKIPWSIAAVRGNTHEALQELHDRYGNVVRVAPNELSFISPRAINDIHGPNPDGGYLGKDRRSRADSPTGVLSVQSADPRSDLHTRHRRLLDHAFTAGALREQEPILKGYIDLLIEKLSMKVKEEQPTTVDIGAWMNYATFDITGDLTVGESFKCLENQELGSWIEQIFTSMQANVLQGTVMQFPVVEWLLHQITPKHYMQARIDHFNGAARKVDKRLALGSERRDFMGALLKNGLNESMQFSGKSIAQGISRPELYSNAGILIIGGSETTASLLSSCFYLLCQNPRVMERLTAEIRGAFASEDEITLETVPKLDYLTAVLKESLRLFPPIVGLIRVAPPGGAHVDGIYLPGNATVQYSLYAAFRSSCFFTDPASFTPERWTGEDPRFNTDTREVFKPFSLGPSNCMGERLAWAMMRVMISRFIFKFDFKWRGDPTPWEHQKNWLVWQHPPLPIELTLRQGYQNGSAK